MNVSRKPNKNQTWIYKLCVFIFPKIKYRIKKNIHPMIILKRIELFVGSKLKKKNYYGVWGIPIKMSLNIIRVNLLI